MKISSNLQIAALTAMVCFPLLSHANVVITGTRVIYHEGDREVTVKLENAGQQPALVQVWVDKGNEKSTPTNADAPFLLTPPIFRVDPNKGQSIRLMFTGEKLPADRESIYWLNVLDVPPLPKGDVPNYVQLAIKSRIKIFYRPKNLGSPAKDAEARLLCSIATQAGETKLHAHNTSPYYTSLNFMVVKFGDKEFVTNGGMVPPFGDRDFIFPDAKPSSPHIQSIKYELIDDHGGTSLLDCPGSL